MLDEKKPYAKPCLIVHGELEALTQAKGKGHTSHGKGLGLGHCKNRNKPGHIHDDNCFVGSS